MSDTTDHRSRLSGTRLLARNVGLQVGGQVSVIVIAFATVPVLVHGLGTARFGVLTLAWLLIGYAGLFDLGLGRALTKFTSERLGAGRDGDLPPLFWTSLGLMLGIGVLIGVVLAGGCPWLARHAIRMPPRFHGEATAALLLLALSVPAVLTSSAVRGFLEAQQRFDLTNGLVVTVSLISYGGPALIVQFLPTLPAVVGVVVFSRYFAAGMSMFLCLRAFPALRRRSFQRALVRPLLTFGGSVTVTTLGLTVLETADRLVIGATISASAVAYYATPYQATSQMLMLSASLVGVLFPAFALNFDQGRTRLRELFGHGTRFAFLALFPPVLVIVTFAPEILNVWLGGDFPRRSGSVMQILAMGVLFTGVAQIFFGLAQSARPSLTAKVVAIELPLYLLGFAWALSRYGTTGAAAAWLARSAFDAALLGFLSWRLVPELVRVLRGIAAFLVASLGVLAAATLLDGLAVKAVFVVVVLVAFGPAAWWGLLDGNGRDVVVRRLRRGRLDRTAVANS